MTTIFYAEPELVIAYGRKVLFLNPNDLQIFKDIELPADLTSCGLKITAPEISEEQQSTSEGKGTDGGKVEVAILNVCYSPDRQLIALTTAGQKALLLYKSRPEHAKLLSVRALARASSAMTFAADSSSVLVTDKTGDCYQYDCVEVNALPRLLLGHLSIVYDILWTPDQKHIITSDRDDKIRVTNYPATFDIHSYCLGHKEFVSGLALLTEEHLLSVSGDKTLRLWNYLSGMELLHHDLPAPAVRLHMRELLPAKRYQAAVQFYDHIEAIGLYELEQTNNIWTVACEQLVRAEAGSWNISNFALTSDMIYVAGAVNEHLALRVYNASDGEQAKTVPAGWLDMVTGSFSDQTCVPEDLSVWFKKRYDNVSDYMERKKRRIEGQQQK
ncbi:tRNA (guanine-N(7)-)-methyltransferase non-catalytic subunit wuho [Drosophila grimshawi]|uniref:tRNA (guanine-N(7)-)-methyltransferase non-catalytic subunit wuho n=1 Tax=Drosophila grimshawi TaxID=7222 RepID=WUHO_DROGR|nr:tRNA (guanine-N(7)-)-methyltransferase non-catalytic subunit wuho [Drosophila grimshawi]B4JWS7.1 RecName: Full=tRNA (guanine-N(7)-)-methyltransferase non-catalytic subunit wuho [Drosophila grimshawi]EDV95203.1 GH17702 [Drosophila grimshawi]